jgi:hypothetical protein
MLLLAVSTVRVPNILALPDTSSGFCGFAIPIPTDPAKYPLFNKLIAIRFLLN